MQSCSLSVWTHWLHLSRSFCQHCSGRYSSSLCSAPRIRLVSRWNCALYKFTYLLT